MRSLSSTAGGSILLKAGMQRTNKPAEEMLFAIFANIISC